MAEASPLLTYCTNIHPGESWQETFSAIRQHLPAIKAAVSPGHPFPLGLRLSRRAAAELSSGNPAFFSSWLEEQGCFIPTINGFPFGAFHHQPIKEQVYLPDWRSRERAEYTMALATLLAEWLPEAIPGSVSTLPLGFKGHLAEGRHPALEKNLEAVLTTMLRLKEERGKTILLALEPEPGCLLETTEEVCRFFEDLALPSALKNHLGVCFDCCHQAVQFEDPAESLARLAAAGIAVAKVQVASALRFAGTRAAELAHLDEPCYLHQVVVRKEEGGFSRFADIPEALRRRQPRAGDEWRCHFHVPVFLNEFAGTATTQDFLLDLLPRIPKQILLEIETYTWGVLPEEYREPTVTRSIIRELHWLREVRHA